MGPHPTGRPGLIRIPGPALAAIAVRFALLSDRDDFDPSSWPQHALAQSAVFPGWWEIDLDAMGLADGLYEYEFAVNGAAVPDPYADAITRFGGYRGLFTIGGGVCIADPFDWAGEFPAGVMLPQNNKIMIYEMPIKWMASDPHESAPLAELGTFDKVIFEHLKGLAASGVNCIELLPIEDSPQTLNWGYGTRFFFSPDYDIGGTVDAKYFVKRCHQLGVRVFLDVVMNMFPDKCPLYTLAPQWFYEPNGGDRNTYAQNLFRYNTPAYGSYYAAREFLCEMAEYWVSEYHIDGYRVDDFKDIENWDFVQEFHDRATAQSATLFPGKPFWVVAEDTNRDFFATTDDPRNPGSAKVVDALWNFGYRDEVRNLLTNSISTNWGEASRSQRVAGLISKNGVWNGLTRVLDPGYADMACSVDYITSHDVADAERLMNLFMSPMVIAAGLVGNPSDPMAVLNVVKNTMDASASGANATANGIVQTALQRVFGGFAVLMTSVGIPMFLAGEEFGDVHDLSFTDVDPKQQDPVQWVRAMYPMNAALNANVAKLIQLRASHPALERNEVEFFYFHPQFDDPVSPRVFAYCRSQGLPLGNAGQVIVVANMGPDSFPSYDIPEWRWQAAALTEVGYANAAPVYNAMSGALNLALNPFSARVFTT
jgi:1,4-alpha-glucan branching enzyme